MDAQAVDLTFREHEGDDYLRWLDENAALEFDPDDGAELTGDFWADAHPFADFVMWFGR
jgi:hypothetical protein